MNETGAAAANPYIIDLGMLIKDAFIVLLVTLLAALLIKIILDLRRMHYGK